MRRLFLFRHGKSSWDNPELRDYDRPLAPRGRRAVPQMAVFMARHGLHPSRIICSGARRTRETAATLIDTWKSASDDGPSDATRPLPGIRFDDTIFDAMPADLYRLMTHLDEDEAAAEPLMIVGHSPGLEMLATALVREPKEDAPLSSHETERRRALAAKYPTAALAVLECPIDDWSCLKPRTATLALFQVPRALDQGVIGKASPGRKPDHA